MKGRNSTKALNNLIVEYLQEKDTDYALMINGEWGSGKTYYVRNTLFPTIENVESDVDVRTDIVNTKVQSWTSKLKKKISKKEASRDKQSTEIRKCKYNPLYVSLYGLSSIEEIYDRIIESILHPIPLRLFTIAGRMANSVASFFNMEIDSNIASDIKHFTGISKDRVLFFDDLERIDTHKVDFQAVLGVINQYVEHDNHKVIVLCNEDKLQDDYKNFIEKTIRFTIQYKAEIEQVYIVICKKEKDIAYKKYLIDVKDQILDIFAVAKCDNMRTLIFILKTFKKVFNAIKQRKDIDDVKKIIDDRLLFYVICAIELKRGHVGVELEELKRISDFKVDKSLFEDTKSDNIDDKESQKSIDKYGSLLERTYAIYQAQFNYYPELVEYVQHGILAEIQLQSNEVESARITQERQLIEQLKNTELIDTSLGEFVDKIMESVKDGKYNIYDLVYIYGSFVQFEYMKIENFKIEDKTIELFKSAIKIAGKKHQYDPTIRYHLLNWSSNDTSGAKEKFEEIYKEAVKVNDEVKSSLEQKQLISILESIRNNDIDTIRAFSEDLANRTVLLSLNVNELVSSLLDVSAKTNKEFMYLIYKFFPDNLVLSTDDFSFIQTLREELNKGVSENDSLKNIWLRYTATHLKNLIDFNSRVNR